MRCMRPTAAAPRAAGSRNDDRALALELHLERHAKTQGNEVAIDARAVITAEEVGVGKAGGIGAEVVDVQAKADGFRPFVEQPVRAVAIDIVGPGDAGFQLYAWDQVVVLPDRSSAVAPGGAGEAIFSQYLLTFSVVGLPWAPVFWGPCRDKGINRTFVRKRLPKSPCVTQAGAH